MALSNTNNKDVLLADGVNTVWAYTFQPIDPAGADIKIIVTDLDGADTIISTNFTLNLATAEVTYPSVISGLPPVASGYKVTLYREEPATQEMVLRNQGAFNANNVEKAFDKLTALIQQIIEQLSRTIQYPISTDPDDLNPEPFLTEVLQALSAAETAAANAAQDADDAADSAAAAAADAATIAAAAAIIGKFTNAAYSIKTSSYVVVSGDVGKFLVMNSASAQAFTLPAITGNEVLIFKNINTGTCTLTPAGGNTVEKSSLGQDETVILIGDLANTKWRVCGSYIGQARFGRANLPLVVDDTEVALTDAATIAVDASLGRIFKVTLGGNRTLANWTNAPSQKAKFIFAIRQDATGGRTLSLDTKYRDLTNGAINSPTTTANKENYYGIVYNPTDDKYDIVAFAAGA